MTTKLQIIVFLRESNAIEGITRPVTDEEIDVTESFLALGEIAVFDMERLVAVYQPDAQLRDRPGLNVIVGSHRAPPGGPEIKCELERILTSASERLPYKVHQQYESLHPFTDGNGRSGRALWLWMMGAAGFQIRFLHRWYYQSLRDNGNLQG